MISVSPSLNKSRPLIDPRPPLVAEAVDSQFFSPSELNAAAGSAFSYPIQISEHQV
jgi:hypothetical protein